MLIGLPSRWRSSCPVDGGCRSRTVPELGIRAGRPAARSLDLSDRHRVAVRVLDPGGPEAAGIEDAALVGLEAGLVVPLKDHAPRPELVHRLVEVSLLGCPCQDPRRRGWQRVGSWFQGRCAFMPPPSESTPQPKASLVNLRTGCGNWPAPSSMIRSTWLVAPSPHEGRQLV